jgi:hypothetical protein
MNIIATTGDIYRAFLRGIRKENTSVVKPSLFNPFINEVLLEVVKGKLPQAEFSQKRIDDLSVLRVVTDGGRLHGSRPVINESSPGVFDLPVSFENTASGQPMDDRFANYPLYLHGINASFRRRDSVQWRGAVLRKSDKTVMMEDNPYRRPTKDRLYFELISGQIRLVGGDQEDTLRLEYYRYPRIINFSTTPGETIDPEFNPSFNQEVTETAIRRYLERVADPRYRSFLQEEMLRSQSK